MLNILTKGREKLKQCYFCGNPATSREHAPPQMMFKSFDCDSITVSSCDLHNSEKSGRDQAIIHGFFKSLRYYYDTLDGDVLKVFNLVEPAFQYTKRTAIEAKMFRNPSNQVEQLPPIAYLPPEIDMPGWVRQLTAAIVYSGTQSYDPSVKWEEIKVASPAWVPAAEPESVDEYKAISYFIKWDEVKNNMADLKWRDGWSAHPRSYPSSIYAFRLHFFTDEIILNHLFYERYSWYVWIPGKKKLITKLEAKIKEENI